MKNVWGSPRIVVEQFAPNEYVAACWGVACDTSSANRYEQTHGPHRGETWYDNYGCTHGSTNCGRSSNQVIYDDNNDGSADRMVEVGTNGLGTLACTIYSDANYTSQIAVSSVSPGDTIYWTTAVSDGRVWHHVGTVYASVPGHPNRS